MALLHIKSALTRFNFLMVTKLIVIANLNKCLSKHLKELCSQNGSIKEHSVMISNSQPFILLHLMETCQ